MYDAITYGTVKVLLETSLTTEMTAIMCLWNDVISKQKRQGKHDVPLPQKANAKVWPVHPPLA